MLVQMLEDGSEVEHHFKVRPKHLEFDNVQTHKGSLPSQDILCLDFATVKLFGFDQVSM